MNDQKKALTWRFSGNELDELTRELRVGGLATEIEPKCFELLLVLLRRAGEAITIAEFQEAIWPGRIVAETAVTNLVSKLRKLLNDENQDVIRTIPKVGYRLAAAVNCAVSGGTAPTIPSLKAGDAIPGRAQWRLSQALESGGYGDVWLAEHVQTGERRVFKFCIDSDRLSALKREVTLNRLLNDAFEGNDHYVRILEWNFEAPPYFIESVYAGTNLRSWFERQGGASALPLSERIGMVATLAEAMATAHSIGVLHKDLKPENILIEERDGRRIVRLGDFGAGRLIDAERLREFGITRLGFTKSTVFEDSSSGSLLYMAPELLSGGLPSVQSDIYSLGVLLYQIVADKLGGPMASGWESDIADELLRQDIADATHGSRERRLASAQLLVIRLRTIDQRRADLERIRREQKLAGEALQSMERSRARRPWMMAATLLLVLGFAASSYFYIRERYQKQQAQEQTRLAQEQERKATEQAQIAQGLNDFITQDVLRAASPSEGGTADETLRDAVLKSIPQVQARFSNQPLVEASIDASLGLTLADLFRIPESLSLEQRASELFNRYLGKEDIRTLEVQTEIGLDLVRLDHYDKAGPIIDSALAIWQSKGVPLDPGYLRARKAKLWYLSTVSPDGFSPEAIAYNKQLIADAEKARMDPNFICTLKRKLIYNLDFQQTMQEAERYATQYLPDFERAYGAEGYRTLGLRMQLAKIQIHNDNLAAAESQLLAIRPSYEKREGPDGVGVGEVTIALSQIYKAQGRWREALDATRRVYQGYVKVFGPRQPATLYRLHEYAWALCMNGHPSDALTLVHQSMDQQWTEMGKDHPDASAKLLFDQVYALLLLHRPAEARSVLQTSSVVEPLASGRNPVTRGYLHLSQAYIALQEGKPDQARIDVTVVKAAFDDALRQDIDFEPEGLAQLQSRLDSLRNSSASRVSTAD